MSPVIDLDADDSSGVTGSGYAAEFVEDNGATRIADDDATLDDPDSSSLASLTVTIENLQDGASEYLTADVAGTNITADYDSGTGVLTLSGTDSIETYQAVLRSVSYHNLSENPNTIARDITVVASDGLNASDPAACETTVVSVNDAPTITRPDTLSLSEDGSLVFSAGDGTAILVDDPDLEGGDLEVTLQVDKGVLTLGRLDGLTFSSGDGTGDSSMVFSDSVSDVNQALEGLKYTPEGDYFGLDSLVLTVDDLGNTGSGGARTLERTVSLTVEAVNDAPSLTLPGLQSVWEDGTLLFSHETANAVTVADVDAQTQDIEVTLQVEHGTLTLGNAASLTFLAGDGSADSTMTVTGSIDAINDALDGLQYTPDGNFFGQAALTIAVDDLGNSGDGGALSASGDVALEVNAVNDAPTVQGPDAVLMLAGDTVTFSTAEETALVVNDVDAGGGSLNVSLAVMHGALTFTGTEDVIFEQGDGTADTEVSFTGSLNAINQALQGLEYASEPGTSGDFTLTVVVEDQQNTGAGGSLSGQWGVGVSVMTVADTPLQTELTATPARVRELVDVVPAHLGLPPEAALDRADESVEGGGESRELGSRILSESVRGVVVIATDSNQFENRMQSKHAVENDEVARSGLTDLVRSSFASESRSEAAVEPTNPTQTAGPLPVSLLDVYFEELTQRFDQPVFP